MCINPEPKREVRKGIGMQGPWVVVRVHSVGQKQREGKGTGGLRGDHRLDRDRDLVRLDLRSFREG